MNHVEKPERPKNLDIKEVTTTDQVDSPSSTSAFGSYSLNNPKSPKIINYNVEQTDGLTTDDNLDDRDHRFGSKYSATQHEQTFTNTEKYATHLQTWQKIEPVLDLSPIMSIPALHRFTSHNFFKKQELIYFGKLMYSSRRYKAYCFLFKNVLLITHKKSEIFSEDIFTVKIHKQTIINSYWNMYPILECKNLLTTDDMTDDRSFYITEKNKHNPQMYHFRTKTVEEKSCWLQALRHLARLYGHEPRDVKNKIIRTKL